MGIYTLTDSNGFLSIDFSVFISKKNKPKQLVQTSCLLSRNTDDLSIGAYSRFLADQYPCALVLGHLL